MSAVDSMINGSGDVEATSDALGKLKDAMTGWQNPASGNIAKTSSKKNTNYDELLSRGWGQYR